MLFLLLSSDELYLLQTLIVYLAKRKKHNTYTRLPEILKDNYLEATRMTQKATIVKLVLLMRNHTEPHIKQMM